MLQVDLKQTAQELSRLITVRCSAFGKVKSVQIHRSPKPFALVEMATRYEALELAAHYERTAFGTCVLLYLEDESHTRLGPPSEMPQNESARTFSTLSCWLL